MKPNKGNDITLGIFGNTSKEEVSRLFGEIVSFLKAAGINFLIDHSLAKSEGYKDSRHVAAPNTILKKVDYILSLGGDGTFLNTARIVGNKLIPILGINLGRLGFFSGIGPHEIKEFIPNLAANKFKVVEQVIIEAKVSETKIMHGINDIVIDKFDSIKMIELEIFYNNERVVKLVSDGIIISTPAGSTGYSLSCNGPIVNPKSKVFVITPISPHTLNIRPIIVPDEGILKVKILKEGKARISADGQVTISQSTPNEVILCKADYSIRVIKKNSYTYFDTLKKKLFWGEDKRHGSKN